MPGPRTPRWSWAASCAHTIEKISPAGARTTGEIPALPPEDAGTPSS